jgi:hypothetical protein
LVLGLAFSGFGLHCNMGFQTIDYSPVNCNDRRTRNAFNRQSAIGNRQSAIGYVL